MAKIIQICTNASREDGDFSKEWPAAGMGYVIVSDNGKLIVVDGGECRNDAAHILGILSSLSNDSVPTVSLWIITHTHLDHFGALTFFSSGAEFADTIKIEKICACTNIPLGFGDAEQELLARTLESLDASVFEPRTQERIMIDGLDIQFLFTWRDHRDINNATSFNELSLVFMISSKNRKMLFTGDSTRVGFLKILESFPHDAIKCDFLQLAHHGLDGGDIEFYKLAAPTVVFVPCSLGGIKFIKSSNGDFNKCSRYARENAQSVICACNGDCSVDF